MNDIDAIIELLDEEIPLPFQPKDEQEAILIEMLEMLGKVNDTLAALNDKKIKLTRKIIETMNLARFKADDEGKIHMVDVSNVGERTYVKGPYKVTVTTKYNASIDKLAYEAVKSSIKPMFNPVEEKISYSIKNEILKNARLYGSEEDQFLIAKFIKETDATPKVEVKPNV